MKTLALSASVLAIGLCATAMNNKVMAGDNYTSEYVTGINLSFPGQAAVLTVRNISPNKMVDAVDLKVQESKLDFDMSGSVTCKSANKVAFHGAWGYFGPVAMGGLNNLKTEATLHYDDLDVAYTDKNHDIAEYTVDTLSVPYSKIKSGHPAIRVDAVAEIEKKLQAFVQNGGKASDFYKQDQDIVLQRPIALVAMCGKPADNTYGYVNKNHTVQIKYIGDPAVQDVPILNAQMNNNPNQIGQNENLPFQLNNIQFQPNIPHYTGKCVPDQNPKIRVNFNIAGGKQGLIDLRIASVSNQYADYGNYFETAGIAKNPNNGGGHLDFSFPLKEMLSQEKYSWMVELNNKTYSHNMRIEARFKNFDGSNQWSQWQEFDTAVFKHRCVPQLAPQLQGGLNGSVGGFQNGDNDSPKPGGTIQAMPVTPKQPVDKIQAQPQKAAAGFLKIEGVKGESRD